MTIEVRHLHQKDRHFFLKFRKVAYFSGWLHWIGANFRIASNEEKYRFMREVLHFRDFSDEELDEQTCDTGKFRDLRLFIAEGEENKHIHLIANAGGSFDSQGNMLALAPDPRFA
jgi:hypothetical protein